MQSEPQAEHHWLHRLIGEWSYEAECTMGPGQAPMRATGSERVRSLGGLWVVCEGHGEMPGGGPATMIMTLGYDPRTKRYRGTWVGSMMTHLWVYDGTLDAQERTLSLEAEGPDFSGEGSALYRDVIELRSDDHRVLTSHKLGEDGAWQAFMTARYRRTA